MKTKFKDFLLYSLACVGAVSLFLSAYQPQQTISTVPASHVWELSDENSAYYAWAINKKTGEVIYTHRDDKNGKTLEMKKYLLD